LSQEGDLYEQKKSAAYYHSNIVWGVYRAWFGLRFSDDGTGNSAGNGEQYRRNYGRFANPTTAETGHNTAGTSLVTILDRQRRKGNEAGYTCAAQPGAQRESGVFTDLDSRRFGFKFFKILGNIRA